MKTSAKKSITHPVAQQNEFIQQSRYKMTKVQHYVFLYMLYKIKPEDTSDTIYEGAYRELCKLSGYTTNSYHSIKKVVKSLESLYFWLDSDGAGKTDRKCRFFDDNSIDTLSKKGTFSFKFGKDLSPYIFDLEQQYIKEKKYFSTYELTCVLMMRNFYSQRLYQLLKTYAYNLCWYDFELGTGTAKDLLRRIGGKNENGAIPKEWKKWSVVKRDVIDTVIREINEYSDLRITYELSNHVNYDSKPKPKVKTELSTVTIRFGFYSCDSHGAESVRILKKGLIANSSYPAIYKHLDDRITEYEKGEADSATKPDKSEQNMDFEEEKKRRISSSKHKLITECYWDKFNEEEIDELYRIALAHIKKRRSTGIDETLICDFISFGLERIKITNEKTRTTTYRRLHNRIIRGYDEKAFFIQEKTPPQEQDAKKSKEYYKELEEFAIKSSLSKTDETNDTDKIISPIPPETKKSDRFNIYLTAFRKALAKDAQKTTRHKRPRNKAYKNGLKGKKYKGFYIVREKDNTYSIYRENLTVYKDSIFTYRDAEWDVDKITMSPSISQVVNQLYEEEIDIIKYFFHRLEKADKAEQTDQAKMEFRTWSHKILNRKIEGKPY